jgi:hypothetical protein
MPRREDSNIGIILREFRLYHVKNGKRPPSDRLAKLLSGQSGKQNNAQNGRISNSFTCGGVLELADRQDLGSCAERREGSSPSFPTSQFS